MKWPLKRAAVPRSEIPLYNLYYLHAPGTNLADPSIMWGTDVDVTLDNYNRFYTLAWFNNGVAGTNIALCGVIVTYELPTTSVFMPSLLRNTR